MASRRIKVLKKICDTLFPLYEGHCQLWQQRGISSATIPHATVTWEIDRSLGLEIRVAQDGRTGRDTRELSIVVDIAMSHDEDVELATVEQVDEQLVIAQKALTTIDWTNVLDEGADTVDIRIGDVLPFPTINDMTLVGGTIRAFVRYGQLESDPEAA